MMAASIAMAARQVRAIALAPSCSHAGRELGRARLRLEKQGHQEMSQNPGFGYSRVFVRRRGQTHQAFQALERHFDAPASAVEFADSLGGDRARIKGGHQNNPSSGG